MEKVKVTREQAEAIESIKDTIRERLLDLRKNPHMFPEKEKSLVDIGIFKIEEALYNGYEVEPEFKVGDWVVKKNGQPFNAYLQPLAVEVTSLRPEENRILFAEDCCSAHFNNIRHATPSEIAEEKERRFWKKLGREVNEYYVGDIIFYSQTRRYHRITGKYDGYITNEFGDRCEVDKLKLVCPAEKRLDVKTNE